MDRPNAARTGRRASARTARRILFVVLAAIILAGGILVQMQWSWQTHRAWQATVARGRYDFATGSCISCHALYPISSAGGAIDLTHEGSRRSLAWLQHEIRFPTSVRPPTPPGQADELAAFLSSLK